MFFPSQIVRIFVLLPLVATGSRIFTNEGLARQIFFRIVVKDSKTTKLEKKLETVNSLMYRACNNLAKGLHAEMIFELREQNDRWMPLRFRVDPKQLGNRECDDRILKNEYSIRLQSRHEPISFNDGSPFVKFHVEEADLLRPKNLTERWGPLGFVVEDVESLWKVNMPADICILADRFVQGTYLRHFWYFSHTEWGTVMSGNDLTTDEWFWTEAFVQNDTSSLFYACNATEVAVPCHYDPAQRCVKSITYTYSIPNDRSSNLCHIRPDREMGHCPKQECESRCKEAEQKYSAVWSPCNAKCGRRGYKRMVNVNDSQELYENCQTECDGEPCPTPKSDDEVMGIVMLSVGSVLALLALGVVVFVLIDAKKKQRQRFSSLDRTGSGFEMMYFDESDASNSSLSDMPRSRGRPKYYQRFPAKSKYSKASPKIKEQSKGKEQSKTPNVKEQSKMPKKSGK